MSDLTKIYASQKEIPEPIGWSTTGESYYYDGTSYVAQDGAISLNKKNNYSAGSYAVAEGYNTRALGDHSHAEGYCSVAKGSSSHAEGSSTEAIGSYSHAEGQGTEATGSYSHVEGCNTKANTAYQHVQGKYNIIDNGSSGEHAHVVGNGTAYNARSNAHTLDWNGNAWFSGEVYTGSTSGTNKDEGSKKLATEEYVNESLSEVGGGSQVYVQETEPTDAQEGDIWVDPNSGTSSVLVAIENGGTGANSAAGALANLGAVKKSGDTMTGDLNIVRNGTSSDSIDFHMDINESDTGNKTVSSLCTRSGDTILAHTKYNANGDAVYVNGFQITKDYIQVLANSDVASNKNRLFLATTKAVAEYAQPKAITTTTDPGDGATVDYPDGTVIYVYE